MERVKKFLGGVLSLILLAGTVFIGGEVRATEPQSDLKVTRFSNSIIEDIVELALYSTPMLQTVEGVKIGTDDDQLELTVLTEGSKFSVKQNQALRLDDNAQLYINKSGKLTDGAFVYLKTANGTTRIQYHQGQDQVKPADIKFIPANADPGAGGDQPGAGTGGSGGNVDPGTGGSADPGTGTGTGTGTGSGSGDSAVQADSITAVTYKSAGFDEYLQIEPANLLGSITAIENNGQKMSSQTTKATVFGSDKYFIDKNDNKIYVNSLNDGTKLTFKNGEVVLGEFTFDRNAKTFTKVDPAVKPNPGAGGNSGGTGGSTEPGTGTGTGTGSGSGSGDPAVQADSITAVTYTSAGFDEYLQIEPANLLGSITAIENNGQKMSPQTGKASVFGSDKYFIDKNDNKIYVNSLNNGTKLTFKNGNTVLGEFIYDKNAGTFRKVSSADKTKELRIRLTGGFENALVNQEKYDGMSGATGSVSSHKNSEVYLELAEVEAGVQEVSEDAWKKYNEQQDIVISKIKGKIENDPVDLGMKTVWSDTESRITLNGVPKKAGEFNIYVELTDALGRSARSNSIPFLVWDNDVKLIDRLKTENMQPLNGGTVFSWNIMNPWVIREFGGDNETVTVPEKMKLWYGSHKSGTYGILGKYFTADSELKQTQTLILEAGTNLYMINMQVTSSVNIIVKKGAKLNLRDSSIHGKITVEDGGIFSMNYDDSDFVKDQNDRFLTGAQINGSLVLKDGAILENAAIYSNTNFLADGKKIRKNEEPVVTVEGNVTVRGQVFVRGDEAATDAQGDKLLTGQPAMRLADGATVNIEKDSVLAVFGGGDSPNTSLGGAGLQMENGTITGEGKLIAVGGNSQSRDGATAISGTGKIEVREAYIQGGNTYNKSNQPSKPFDDQIAIADTTVGVANEGKVLGILNDDDSPWYWRKANKIPVMSFFNLDNPTAINGNGGSVDPDPGAGSGTGTGTGTGTNAGASLVSGGNAFAFINVDEQINNHANGANMLLQFGADPKSQAMPANLPKTGERNSTYSYLVLMVLAVAGVAGIQFKRVRNRR